MKLTQEQWKEWRKAYELCPNFQRLGQAFVNTYALNDNELFYEECPWKAVSYIWVRYIDLENTNE